MVPLMPFCAQQWLAWCATVMEVVEWTWVEIDDVCYPTEPRVPGWGIPELTNGVLRLLARDAWDKGWCK